MQSIPASFQRWAALLLPPLALLACCAVMVPKQKKLREVNKDIVTTQGQVRAYLAQLQQIAELRGQLLEARSKLALVTANVERVRQSANRAGVISAKAKLDAIILGR